MTGDNKNGIQSFIALTCFSPRLCASVAILSIQSKVSRAESRRFQLGLAFEARLVLFSRPPKKFLAFRLGSNL
jgi:hypothetical protein